MAHVAETPAEPSAAETPVNPAPAERRRSRVPTSVILTLVGAVLTVLILPAITRQWDDRQRARELQAALVEEMAVATARALGDSSSHLHANTSEQPIANRWAVASLRIEAKLNAYLTPQIVNAWRIHRRDVNAVIRLAGIGSRGSRGISRPLDYLYREYFLAQLELPGDQLDGVRRGLTSRDPSKQDAERAVESLVLRVLGRERTVADLVLAEHPSGFSITRGDLIRDLLP